MTADPSQIAEVLSFWFGELSPKQWWTSHPEVDETIRERFGTLYDFLAAEVPAGWRVSAQGFLAAVIVLDQFPRNMFRDDPRAFATDHEALNLSREAIDKGVDEELGTQERSFLYMPFQHSEDPAVQAESVSLFKRLGDDNVLSFAQAHKAVIDRFGRFPHRNTVLGRASTAEEIAFLEEVGRGF